MSTAVMPQNAIYEFGDILLKNGVNSSDSTSPAHLASTTTAAVRLSLARMVSSPAAPISSSANLAALIGNLTQQHHRRLERTQSAPAPASSAAAAAAAAAAAVNTSRYKTELCRPYEEFGVCKYGDKCQFAHGVAELRSLARHPKYKTELCRTYHTVGFCPYGPRCHFVHNQDEVIQHREQQHRSVSAAIMVNRSPPPHQHQPPSNQQQPRLRPSALSPSLSLDSPSPPSSLSQSPTSSMGSFFSSEPELHSPTATATIEEQRLPVFNRISAAPLLAFSDFLL